MKNFKAKKFLAAPALGRMIFADTLLAAQATVEISAVVKLQSKVVNCNKGNASEVTNTELNQSERQTLQTVTYTGVVVDASGLGSDTTFLPVIYDTNERFTA